MRDDQLVMAASIFGNLAQAESGRRLREDNRRLEAQTQQLARERDEWAQAAGTARGQSALLRSELHTAEANLSAMREARATDAQRFARREGEMERRILELTRERDAATAAADAEHEHHVVAFLALLLLAGVLR